MKLAQLILVILTIICNEIVVELLLSDERKISILDSSVEEKTEQENTEIEGEIEADFVNEYKNIPIESNRIIATAFSRNISNVANPFLEIHSPPPDFYNITSIV